MMTERDGYLVYDAYETSKIDKTSPVMYKNKIGLLITYQGYFLITEGSKYCFALIDNKKI